MGGCAGLLVGTIIKHSRIFLGHHMYLLKAGCIISFQALQFSSMQSNCSVMTSPLPAFVTEAVVWQESFGVFGTEGGGDQLIHWALGQTRCSADAFYVYVSSWKPVVTFDLPVTTLA